MPDREGHDAACRVCGAALRRRPSGEPDPLPGITRRDVTPLLAWLRRHVHGLGSLYDSRELVTRATGKPLDPQVFKAHLERRYLG